MLNIHLQSYTHIYEVYENILFPYKPHTLPLVINRGYNVFVEVTPDHQ